ncbi:MAG: hypothetical protein H0T42_02990 [Deltaproteobacteria bacterium]|nr:hypothetical protein [Deltaproteobacteria bacterium]
MTGSLVIMVSFGCGDAPTAAEPDASLAIDAALDTDAALPDAVDPPNIPERIETGSGFTPAIAFDAAGRPSVAYRRYTATTSTEILIATRGSGGWSSQTVLTLSEGTMSDVDFEIGPAGRRVLGYVTTTGGQDYRGGASVEDSGAWTHRWLAYLPDAGSLALEGDVAITPQGDVHIMWPLVTPPAETASGFRHLATAGAGMIEETLGARVQGTQFGIGAHPRSIAIVADAGLSMFTLQNGDAPFEAHLSSRTAMANGPVMLASQVASLPGFGLYPRASGAALVKTPTGQVAIGAVSYSNQTAFHVLREGATWTHHTVGPVPYDSSAWCATVMDDGTAAIVVYDEVGTTITEHDLRLILVAPDGMVRDQVIDLDVDTGKCAIRAQGGSVHVVYRRSDDSLYYQRVDP